MSDTIKLATAGNVVVPAFLTLQQRGYSVRRDATSSPGDEPLWHAEREGIHLVAEEPLSLLALAAIIESRGAEWRAADEQIESFLREYVSDPPAA